jgi:1L-myo-inositol 1-phosphate cytidylyltransferase
VIPLATHAVILAAGFGSRLQAQEGHKLLATIGSRTLLHYHLHAFASLGVRDVTVVTGFRHEALEAAIHTACADASLGLHVSTAHNPAFKGSNGLSVLAAVEHNPALRSSPFWLTMADHLFDPALFTHLASPHAPHIDDHAQGALYVDAKLDSIFDMPDATKVALDTHGQLAAIGKEIDPFHLVDVGLFWCAPGFVDALAQARDARGDCSTSDAVRSLCAQRAFSFPDIGPFTWQDVDTPEARAHAERLLLTWQA